MNKSYAVIGAQFGDEGKGGMTNYLAKNKSNPVVIRFNGGAQAGHTVEDIIQGKPVRHVFGHIGSGFFQNAPTWLGPEFICNPLLYYKEKNQLLEKVSAASLMELENNTQLQIHPDCKITTVYDMFINQIIEKARGKNAHGSCGVGILETVKRSEYTGHNIDLTFKDLKNKDYIRNVCSRIRDTWLPKRVKELGLDVNLNPDAEVMPYEKTLVENFIEAAHNFYLDNILSSTPKARDENTLPTYIFEGAQGLMLDQELGVMPHLTPSYTGIRNISDLKELLSLDEVEVFYMTRTYTTRHGNGPLENELSQKPYENIEDKTNIKNDYQGSLRFSYLDLDEISGFIIQDARRNHALHVKPHLVLTCVDQLNSDRNIHFYQNKELKTQIFSDFLDTSFTTFQMEILYNDTPIYSPKPSKTYHIKNIMKK